MVSYVVMEKNQEILSSILKWRCLSVENVIELVGSKNNVNNIRQRIYRLEKYGLLNSKLYANCKKIVFPSNYFLEFLGYKKESEINIENVKHDSYVSTICLSLINSGIVGDVTLPHEYKTKSTWKFQAIEPDAIMTIKQGENHFQVGLEVELWRKSRSRVYEKMRDYAKAQEYDYVFYFFPEEVAFSSYVERIYELVADESYAFLNEQILNKVVLVLMPNSKNQISDFREAKVFNNGEFKTLKKLIGIEK